jgi:predicted RNA-binding Zn-ribbon protein involved in translation (DUF1610 family)
MAIKHNLTEEQKATIIRKLQEKGVNMPCPRCGNPTFSLVEGYFVQPIQNDLRGGLVIGGPAIPSVIVICNKCGFISQHALGPLGLLPESGGQ